jgi:hypothetical protein
LLIRAYFPIAVGAPVAFSYSLYLAKYRAGIAIIAVFVFLFHEAATVFVLERTKAYFFISAALPLQFPYSQLYFLIAVAALVEFHIYCNQPNTELELLVTSQFLYSYFMTPPQASVFVYNGVKKSLFPYCATRRSYRDHYTLPNTENVIVLVFQFPKTRLKPETPHKFAQSWLKQLQSNVFNQVLNNDATVAELLARDALLTSQFLYSYINKPSQFLFHQAAPRCFRILIAPPVAVIVFGIPC